MLLFEMTAPPSPIQHPTLPRPRAFWRRREMLIFGLLFALANLAYCGTHNSEGQRGGVAELDGYYYYIYLRSLAYDHDIDLRNDYAKWGNPFAFGTSPTGLARNVFGVGPAIVWSPFFAAAQLGAAIARATGHWVSNDGMSRLHHFITFWGSLFYGWLAVVLCWLFVRQVLGGGLCLLGAAGAALVGPLPYYCLHGAAYSHAAAAMASSLALWLWARFREGWSPRRWFIFGGALGLALLVRPATAPLLLLGVWEAVRMLRGRNKCAGRGRAIGAPLAGVAALLLVFFPQLLAWQRIYGSPLVLPQGGSFMWWSESAWAQTLFAPRNGLFPSAPLYLLAVVALFLALRKANARTWALPLVALFLAVAFVNGAVYDWWGWSFSARRYTFLLPLFALGLTYALRAIAARITRNPARTAALACTSLVALFALFNGEWVAQFSGHNLRWYSVRSTQGLYMTVINGVFSRVYRATGNPLSFPAAAAYALHTGAPLTSYDKVEGSYLLGEQSTEALPFADPYRSATFELANPRIRPQLSRSFGPTAHEGTRRYVPLMGRHGTILLPINRPGGLKLWLRAKAVAAGTDVSALFNGQGIGRRTLAADHWDTLYFEVEAKDLRRGINRLDLLHKPPPLGPVSRAVGTTSVVSPLDLAVVSGGNSRHSFCAFWLGARELRCERGLNLIALDHRSGRVLAVRSFDAVRYPGAFAQATGFLASLPPSTIIAFATRGDVSVHFAAAGGERTLRAFGAASSLATQTAGGGYAAIGVLGAASGSALESLRHVGQTEVWVGHKPEAWRELARYHAMRLR